MSMHLKPLTPIEEEGLRAHGLPVGVPSQLADAFRLGMAWADEARAAPWKSAVIDQLVVAHILTAEHENDPLKAVQDLLAYHSDIAVDPRVSGAAAGLVEQAKAEQREASAAICRERAQVWRARSAHWQHHQGAAIEADLCADKILKAK